MRMAISDDTVDALASARLVGQGQVGAVVAQQPARLRRYPVVPGLGEPVRGRVEAGQGLDAGALLLLERLLQVRAALARARLQRLGHDVHGIPCGGVDLALGEATELLGVRSERGLEIAAVDVGDRRSE